MEGNIQTTVREFEKFINFNESESPVLSAKQGVLGKKDSYRLNEMLSYNRDVKGPNYTQNQYPIVDLLFTLSLAGRLHVKASNDKGKPALIETNVMESYKSLNQYEKYAFLLQTYWTKYDFRGKFDTRSGYSFYALLNLMANAKPGLRIIKNNREQTYGLFSFEADFFHHLRFFGFGELEEIQGAKGKFEDSIRAFIPNEFGIHVSKFLLSKGLPSWNIDNYTYVLPRNSRNKPSNPFDVFREIFPDGKVINTVDSEAKFDTSGVYTFKVSLSKSCWRKINISHRHTLYDLHIAIQDAFDFDNDHL
ncbi:MAG: hypothetical protein PHE70_03730 [Tepidanaerobacteraceae bacterium]|nr:hypothetical protein [Tepidanaerobacteraceae bacterium]